MDKRPRPGRGMRNTHTSGVRVDVVICWFKALMGTQIPGGRAERLRIRELERSCRRLLRKLNLPLPLDIGRLCEGIAAERGRPIVLLPFPARPGNAVASWVATTDTDVIFFAQDTDPLHRFHIIAHELGHLLAGHAASEEVDVDDEELLRTLFPNAGLDMVNRMLGRHRNRYDDYAEFEAERVATMIRWWADIEGSQQVPVVVRSSTRDAALVRFAEALFERRGWR